MKKLLHLGTQPLEFMAGYTIDHCPILAFEPLPWPTRIIQQLSDYRTVIVTSKQLVPFFFQPINGQLSSSAAILAIGQKTHEALKAAGYFAHAVARFSTQEGMIDLMEELGQLKEPVCYPRSSLARDLMREWLMEKNIKHDAFFCYRTIFNPSFQRKDLDGYDAVYFSSPSCVKFFFDVYSKIPPHLTCYTIGPVTEKYFMMRQARLIK